MIWNYALITLKGTHFWRISDVKKVIYTIFVKSLHINRLGGEVSKVFPDLLLATMDIIHTQYKNLKGHGGYAFNTDDAKERVSISFLFYVLFEYN